MDHLQPSATDIDLQRLATGLRKLVANAYPDYINKVLDFFDDPQTIMNLIDHANLIKQEGEYATETDIAIISKLFNVEIAVYYPDGSVNKFYDRENTTNNPLFTINIGYVDGHYVAIRTQDGVAPIYDHRYQTSILNMLKNIENNIPNNPEHLYIPTDIAPQLLTEIEQEEPRRAEPSNSRGLTEAQLASSSNDGRVFDRIREPLIYSNTNHSSIIENTAIVNNNISVTDNVGNTGSTNSTWRNLCTFSRAAIPVLGSIAVGILINNGGAEYITKKIYDYFNG